MNNLHFAYIRAQFSWLFLRLSQLSSYAGCDEGKRLAAGMVNKVSCEIQLI